MTQAPSSARYDGLSGEELAGLLELPRVVVFDDVPSTLDVAHELGAHGAEAGTLVLADMQSAGRGRLGRAWQSERGAGVWLTLVERPTADDSLGVRSLRVALRLAPAVDPFADEGVMLKWPNDLYVRGRKLAGVLLESRWRAGRLDWLAAGIGINVRAPSGVVAAALRRGTTRVGLLCAIVPAIREAIATGGPLDDAERAAYAARDFAMGQRCREPAVGVVAGVDADGALLVQTPDGRRAFRGGSLVLEPVTAANDQSRGIAT